MKEIPVNVVDAQLHLRLTRRQLCSDCNTQNPTSATAATRTACSNPGKLLITYSSSHKSLYIGPEHLFNSLRDDISLIPQRHYPNIPIRTLKQLLIPFQCSTPFSSIFKYINVLVFLFPAIKCSIVTLRMTAAMEPCTTEQ